MAPAAVLLLHGQRLQRRSGGEQPPTRAPAHLLLALVLAGPVELRHRCRWQPHHLLWALVLAVTVASQAICILRHMVAMVMGADPEMALRWI